MVVTRNKLMVGVLALIMAFAVFGVMGAAQVYADAPDGYSVTWSTYGDGVITYDPETGAKASAKPENVKPYSAAELDAAADVQAAHYMWSKGTSASVYAVKKGISFQKMIADAVGEQPIAQIYTWDAADFSKLYKAGNIKDHIDGPTYWYPKAIYNAEKQALDMGDGTQVVPALALDYQVAALGEGTPAAEDLTDYSADGEYVNRVFLGMLKDTETGGKLSQTNSYGIHIVLKADQDVSVKAKTVTVKKGKSIDASKLVEVTGAESEATYTAKAANAKAKKALKVSKGKITVKKGAKKGSYKVKVTVKVAGDDNYKAFSKAVTSTVKVK